MTRETTPKEAWLILLGFIKAQKNLGEISGAVDMLNEHFDKEKQESEE